MKKIIFLLTLYFVSQLATAQKSLLQSGPMLGYCELMEVMVWVQTKEQAKVKIQYAEIADSKNKGESQEIVTQSEKGYTAKLILAPLQPGKKYAYKVYINGKEVQLDYPTTFNTLPVWQWRSNAPDYTFVAGSGTYINETDYDRPGEPYGGDYLIFESINKIKADFLLWLGDNIYLREADWNTKTGIYHRYTHTRSTKEMQALLASVPNYAIWDDHDAGPDNCDRGFWNINTTFEAFKDFWANPSYGVGSLQGAITSFQWSDGDFFLLDNRTYRSPNKLKSENKTILGKQQLEWLKDALVSSRATFKFVVMGGQLLNPAGEFETYSNNGFAAERQEIIDFIQEQKISGVLFITGDRHHSELSILERKGCPRIFDITSSPFTSGAGKYIVDEINALRVKGSLITQRNYATIKVTGIGSQRKVSLSFNDSNGKLLWSYAISSDMLMCK